MLWVPSLDPEVPVYERVLVGGSCSQGRFVRTTTVSYGATLSSPTPGALASPFRSEWVIRLGVYQESEHVVTSKQMRHDTAFERPDSHVLIGGAKKSALDSPTHDPLRTLHSSAGRCWFGNGLGLGWPEGASLAAKNVQGRRPSSRASVQSGGQAAGEPGGQGARQPGSRAAGLLLGVSPAEVPAVLGPPLTTCSGCICIH